MTMVPSYEPRPGERLLFACTHRLVFVGERLVRIVRSATPVDSAMDLVDQYQRTIQAMAGLRRSALVLLLDGRLAPLRNDAAVEEVLPRLRGEMTAGFQRVAMLVAGSLQRLQFERYAREDGGNTHVFDDEAAALEFALSGVVGHVGAHAKPAPKRRKTR